MTDFILTMRETLAPEVDFQHKCIVSDFIPCLFHLVFQQLSCFINEALFMSSFDFWFSMESVDSEIFLSQVIPFVPYVDFSLISK